MDATYKFTSDDIDPLIEDNASRAGFEAGETVTEPYDKAGAYAIQGHAALWCSGIVGCYYNIMGLPVHRLAQVLRQAGAL